MNGGLSGDGDDNLSLYKVNVFFSRPSRWDLGRSFPNAAVVGNPFFVRNPVILDQAKDLISIGLTLFDEPLDPTGVGRYKAALTSRVDGMTFSFVLVEPASEENIGAAARALKTMGFDDLRLVNPQTSLGKVSRYVAHGAHDILDEIKIFPDLESAVKDSGVVVGTTRPLRSNQKPMLTEVELRGYLNDKFFGAGVSIVFGRERTGLTSQELDRCDLLSFIPLAQRRPALNLGQAVMLYAYNLASGEGFESRPHDTGLKVDLEEVRHLKSRVAALLDLVGGGSRPKTRQTILGRLPHLGLQDMRLIQHVLSMVEPRISSAAPKD